MKETIRRYWPLWAYATASLIAVVLIVQHGNARAERQRQALCAILANIAGEQPPPIQQARAAFAPPDHPRQCYPNVKRPRHAKPAATASPRATSRGPVVVVTVTSHPTVGPSSQQPTPRPTATRTPPPRPPPSPSPTPPVCLPPLIPC